MGVILQQPDWGFPRLTTELKVGMALWPSTISFPIAQIGLQILFVLIVAGTALRGELGRFVEVFRTPGKLALLLLPAGIRSEEHTSELQSLMRSSYAVFCLKKKK